LQDALKEHGKLFRRPVAVFLGQLQHRILGDVKGIFFLADGEQGLLEGAPLDRFEKAGKLSG